MAKADEFGMGNEEADTFDDLFASRSRRRRGRPRGTSKIPAGMQAKYEVLILFLRYMLRKYGVPQMVVNKIFYLLEDPAFVGFMLRSLQKIAHKFILAAVFTASSKVFKAILEALKKSKRTQTNPPLIKPLWQLFLMLYRTRLLNLQDTAKMLFLLKQKKHLEAFNKQVLALINKAAKTVPAAQVKAWLKTTKTQSSFGKSVRSKQRKAVNPPAFNIKEGKLHEIYTKVLGFTIKNKKGEFYVTLRGPAKIFGIEGGEYDGGILIRGTGVRGIPLLDTKLVSIEATKGKLSNWAGEDFIHKFTAKPPMQFTSPTCILCYKKGKRLHKVFQY